MTSHQWICPARTRQQKEVCGGEDQGAEGRTDAEPTYDADADAARDPAQEAVPCTRDFADALHVIVWRQSLLA
jgi:hypothetical protein